MIDKTRGDYAYSIIDIATTASDEIVGKISAIDGVLKVRVIK